MKRMLEARAELSTRGSFDLPRLSEEGAGDSEGGDSSSLARRLMEIFHFESPELVLSGMPSLPSLVETNADSSRISLLAAAERFVTRLYVHHQQAYLLLCILAKEISESFYSPLADLTNPPRPKLSSLDTYRNPVNGTPNITDTGFA
jgi:hypothetical protein